MSVNLGNLFQSARDRAAGHAGAYGVPTYRLFTVGTRDGAAYTWLDVHPCPHIDQVNPRLVSTPEDLRSIQYELDDLRVEGISKTYPLAQLRGPGRFYVVGADAATCQAYTTSTFDQRGIQALGAIVADLVPGTEIEEQHQLHWSLTLRRRKRA